MSTLQVANIHLESTANNRIQYNGSNSYLIVAGGTTVATVNSSALVLGTSGLSANGSLGSAGQVLHSNGTATYWSTDDNSGGTVTSVGSGNGLTGGPITSSGTLSVLANSGIVANATGVYVNATYIGTLTSNNALYLGGVAAASYQLNSTLAANVAILTANNANNLNGQAPSYYLNATNINSGTLNTARISGAYTGITQVGTLSGLTVTGNSNFDSGVLFVDGTNNKVGVNTASPSVSLQIAANDALIVPIGTDAQRPTAANGMLRYSTTSNAFEGYANGAWGAIGGGGGAAITNDTSTNSNTNYLVFANTSSGSLDDALISTTKLYYNPSTGQLNATNFNSLSDREKKDNIEVITDALDLVNNINGVRFTWKENGLPSAGLIAQELKTIMPELVGDDMSVNYSGVIGLLVQCIKELNEKINDLQSK